MKNQYLSLFFIFIFLTYKVTNKECPPKSKNTPPSILFKPPTAIRGIENKFICASCCFDGFIKLQWRFRELNEKKWNHILSLHHLDESNRTLCLHQPFNSEDTGYYQCMAEDNYNNSISYSIFLYFLKANQPETITIVDGNLAPRSDYNIGTNVDLICKAISYIPYENISVNWFFKAGNSMNAVKKHKINTTISNRQIEANPDQVDVFSHLYVNNVKVTDGGYYQCLIVQGNSNASQKFLVSVINEKVNWRTLLSIIVGILLLVLVLNIGWYRRFNIMVMYKTYFALLPSKYEKEYDVSILYDDSDYTSQPIALTILEILEKFKFRCWHFDRDKQYGQETVTNQSQVINGSQTTIVLLSKQSIVDGCLLKNLSALQPDVTTKRLYIFNPHQKEIFKELDNTSPNTKTWLKQELKFQSFIHPHSFNLNSNQLSHFNELFAWIVSSLPSTAIQAARQRIIEAEKMVLPECL